jgi:hypothetical protein
LLLQADVDEACGGSRIVLKPYQLVGVNFLTLIHEQNIEGGKFYEAHNVISSKVKPSIAFLFFFSSHPCRRNGLGKNSTGMKHTIFWPNLEGMA